MRKDDENRPFFVIGRESIMKKMYVILAILLFNILPLRMTEAASPDLAITVDFPDNQQSKETGYFDLLVKPGEKQELKLRLKNVSKEEIEASVAVNTATTSYLGGIDYSQKYDPSKKDTSLQHPMSEILVPEKEQITIPPGEEIPVVFSLSVPAEQFEGILLGAIQVTQVSQEDTNGKEATSGMVINNRMAYSIGVKLSEDVALSNESQLDLLRVEASQQTGRNNVFVHLQHPTADIVEKVTYDGKVTKKNSDDVLHRGKASDYRIAPNSTFFFPISWENQRFEAGEYVLKLTAKSEESDASWSFEEAFTITREEARELNEKAVDLGVDYRQWLIIGGIILLVVIIIVTVIVISIITIRKKQREKRRAQRRKKGRSKSDSTRKRKSTSRQGGKS